MLFTTISGIYTHYSRKHSARNQLLFSLSPDRQEHLYSHQLNISLALNHDESDEAREHILQILISHLMEDACIEFKMLNHTRVESLQQSILNKTDEHSLQLQQYLLPLKQSEQFIIYFQKQYDAKKILLLCKEIELLFKQRNIQAGKTPVAALPITQHLSMNHCDANCFSHTAFLLQKNILNSELYLLLKKHFHRSIMHKNACRLFYQQQQREMDLTFTHLLKI